MYVQIVDPVRRCPTRKEWNAIQDFKVRRSPSLSRKPRASFQTRIPSNDNNSTDSNHDFDRSWFGDVYSGTELEPFRMTD